MPTLEEVREQIGHMDGEGRTMIPSESRWKSRLAGAAIGAALVAVAPAPGAAGGAASTVDAGTLTFQAALLRESRMASCAPGVPASVECFAREGTGAVRGLGTLSVSYVYLVDTAPADCPSGSFKLRASTGRFVVAGKGEIELAFDDQPGCYVPGGGASVSQAFTITGGSAAYARASGSGTVAHETSAGPVGPGRDFWTGTLVVPGFNFDLTAPTFSGTVGKTVRAPRRAKRVRVTYSVTATDDVDGAVSASCRPGSGSRFRVGRTVVRCSATDSSANTATARFTIVVKRR